MDIRLDQECEIRILQPHYFLATKIEAFKNRGGGDGRMSSDFEDIIFVLNNRRAIWDEMEKSSADIKTYLRNEWAVISENEYFYEWIGAHLDYVEQGRVSYIVGGLINFIRSQQAPIKQCVLHEKPIWKSTGSMTPIIMLTQGHP